MKEGMYFFISEWQFGELIEHIVLCKSIYVNYSILSAQSVSEGNIPTFNYFLPTGCYLL